MLDTPVLIHGARIAGTLMDKAPDKHGLIFVNVGDRATRVHPDLIERLPALHGDHRLTIRTDVDGQGQSCGCGRSLAPMTGLRQTRLPRWMRVAA